MRGFYKFGKSKSGYGVGISELIFPFALGVLAQFGLLESIIGLTTVIFIFTVLRNLIFSSWQTHLIFAFSVSLSFIVINESISFWISQDYHYEITVALLLIVSLILLMTKKGIRISYTTNFLSNPSWIFRTIVITVLLNVGLQFLKSNAAILIVEDFLFLTFLSILIIMNVQFRRVLKEIIRPMTPEMEIEVKKAIAEYEKRNKE